MISPDIRAQIRRYFYVEHWKVGTIASELNVHPDAVRHAIESDRLQIMGSFLGVDIVLGESVISPALDDVWTAFRDLKVILAHPGNPNEFQIDYQACTVYARGSEGAAKQATNLPTRSGGELVGFFQHFVISL